MSGWPSGLRRQTQGIPYLLIARVLENYGPLMRAWVRIPLLTKDFLLFLMYLLTMIDPLFILI